MATFNSKISHSDIVIPPQYANEIIKEITKKSTVLTFGNKVTMSSAEYKQNVLSTLPQSYFVDEGGLAQTTKAAWENLTITAEKLATIVPIPKTLLEDSEVKVYDEIIPLIAQSMGQVIDSAVLFGVNKPTSWGDAIVPRAKAVKNVVKLTNKKDLTKAVPELASKVGKQGYSLNGFVAPTGTAWDLLALRDSTGQPIYAPSLQNSTNGKLYGYPLHEVANGSFDFSDTCLVGVDWKKFLIGIRQDMKMSISEEGTITDDTGKVVYNLFQQDMVALKFTMRVGYQVANPVTALESDKNKRFPAGVIVPVGSSTPEVVTVESSTSEA